MNKLIRICFFNDIHIVISTTYYILMFNKKSMPFHYWNNGSME